jgi:hypothetical protein
VRWTTTVTVSAVNVLVLASLSCNSLNHGLLLDTTGVAVTLPPPPPVTVRFTVVVRTTLPEVAVNVTAVVPSAAVADAVKVAVTELPVVAVDGLNVTVTPLGNPLAVTATAPVKLVRLIAMVDAPLPPRATLSVPGDAATL